MYLEPLFAVFRVFSGRVKHSWECLSYFLKGTSQRHYYWFMTRTPRSVMTHLYHVWWNETAILNINFSFVTIRLNQKSFALYAKSSRVKRFFLVVSVHGCFMKAVCKKPGNLMTKNHGKRFQELELMLDGVVITV